MRDQAEQSQRGNEKSWTDGGIILFVQDGSPGHTQRQRAVCIGPKQAASAAAAAPAAAPSAAAAACASINARPGTPAAVVSGLQPGPAVTQSSHIAAGLWHTPPYGLGALRLPAAVSRFSRWFLRKPAATSSAATAPPQRSTIAEPRTRARALAVSTKPSCFSQRRSRLPIPSATTSHEPGATTPVPAEPPVPSRQLPPADRSRGYDGPASRHVYARTTRSPYTARRGRARGASLSTQGPIGAVDPDVGTQPARAVRRAIRSR